MPRLSRACPLLGGSTVRGDAFFYVRLAKILESLCEAFSVFAGYLSAVVELGDFDAVVDQVRGELYLPALHACESVGYVPLMCSGAVVGGVVSACEELGDGEDECGEQQDAGGACGDDACGGEADVPRRGWWSQHEPGGEGYGCGGRGGSPGEGFSGRGYRPAWLVVVVGIGHMALRRAVSCEVAHQHLSITVSVG